MDKRRIENYKKMADDSAAIIYDEKVKLFEYEQMWSAKKQERQNMFFVKRFFDKETKADMSSIQDYINISNDVITQTKTSWEKEIHPKFNGLSETIITLSHFLNKCLKTFVTYTRCYLPSLRL